VLLFRQLADPQSSTYTYLLADGDSRAAVLIDPVFEQMRRDAALIGELDLTLRYTLDTHVHADHISAGRELAEALTELRSKLGITTNDVQPEDRAVLTWDD
jgi:glyoxylase-like metal-dependent hydrolase (beta-lactamase superfamily II)